MKIKELPQKFSHFLGFFYFSLLVYLFIFLLWYIYSRNGVVCLLLWILNSLIWFFFLFSFLSVVDNVIFRWPLR